MHVWPEFLWQRVASRKLANSESFCEVIGSIDSEL